MGDLQEGSAQMAVQHLPSDRCHSPHPPSPRLIRADCDQIGVEVPCAAIEDVSGIHAVGHANIAQDSRGPQWFAPEALQ